MAEADANLAELAVRRPLTPPQQALVDGVREPIRAIAKRTVRYHGGDVDDLAQIGVEVACRKAQVFVPGEASFWTAIFVRAEMAMLEAIQSDRRERYQAIAALRAAREVHGCIDVGDILEEEAEQRVERRDEARFAIAGASIIGMSLPPATPEQMLMDEQERVGLRAAVDRALGELEQVDRRLVVMCTMEDATVKDAAAVLGLAYEPARERLRKATARVGRRLRRVAA